VGRLSGIARIQSAGYSLRLMVTGAFSLPVISAIYDELSKIP
jgi:hypothetical protein